VEVLDNTPEGPEAGDDEGQAHRDPAYDLALVSPFHRAKHPIALGRRVIVRSQQEFVLPSSSDRSDGLDSQVD
jgi:hypothetical protein